MSGDPGDCPFSNSGMNYKKGNFFSVCGCVSMWVCGCVRMWVCENVGMWLCGCVSMWVCENLSVWCVCGHVSVWVCGYVRLWVCECVGVWICKFMGVWVLVPTCVQVCLHSSKSEINLRCLSLGALHLGF